MNSINKCTQSFYFENQVNNVGHLCEDLNITPSVFSSSMQDLCVASCVFYELVPSKPFTKMFKWTQPFCFIYKSFVYLYSYLYISRTKIEIRKKRVPWFQVHVFVHCFEISTQEPQGKFIGLLFVLLGEGGGTAQKNTFLWFVSSSRHRFVEGASSKVFFF